MLNILDEVNPINTEPVYSDRELKASRDYLTRKLSRAEASGMPFAEVVTVTPELASLLLQRNPSDENRKLSRATVAKYASDMRAGRWQGMNGQTIVISKDGYLNDGQHRLNAVIECEGHIPFTIVFGAERESRMTLDQNKIRTSGDYIGMAGVGNANKVAAVAAILIAYETDSFRNSGNQTFHSQTRPTKAALHAYALSHLDEITTAIHVADNKAARRFTTDTRLAATLCIIARKAGFERAKDFIERVVDGDGLRKSDPEFKVRERLMGDRLTHTPPVRRTLEIIIRGWNKRQTGDVKDMSLRGDLPEIVV